MELEFDKEIDAILRKARDTRGVLVGDNPPEPKKHLDADTIAAFAEGALPERAKMLFTKHLADCDRCRKQLSQSIAFDREAGAAAASIVSAPGEAIATPWYARLFRTPNLAIVMGSLVLVFSGVLGFILLQRQAQNAANNAGISQSTAPDASHGPYYSEPPVDDSNTAAAANSANTATEMQPSVGTGAIATVANSRIAAPVVPGGDLSRTMSSTEEKESLADKNVTVDSSGSGAPASKPAVPAGAPPPPADQPKTESDNIATLRQNEARKDDDAKAKMLSRDEGLAVGGRDTRSRALDREAMPPALKKEGPSRAGPLNNQSQNQVNTMGEMSVTRSVGGKSFANRNGAWYDAAYRQQATINVHRGSDEFKKLDGGLRSIANQLYGVVIVVWKGKAYRIN